jgi:hypothetical protein
MDTEQKQRITMPLFHCIFDDNAKGRIKVNEDIILAELNIEESRRVQQYHANAAGYTDEFNLAFRIRPPGHRIEIFPEINQDMTGARIKVHDKVTDAMSLFAIASRAAPAWYSEPVDKWNNDASRWERMIIFDGVGGTRPHNVDEDEIKKYLPTTVGPAWRVSVDAVEAWGRLCSLWGRLPAKSPLSIAAWYFYDAITTLNNDYWRAFISASICLECMLGDSSTELSYRISQRAANLGRVLDLDSDETYQYVRKSYNARSKLVHEGRHPDAGSTIAFLELLRRLLPVMAVLDSESETHQRALVEIDSVSIGKDQVITNLKKKSSIWSLPEINGDMVHSRKEYRRLVQDLFPEMQIPDFPDEEA